MSVLVTGAGGPAGVAVIRALVAAGEKVIAADADPLAVGLRLAHEGVVVPRADADAFGDAVLTACRRWDVDALVPTVAEELTALAALHERLDASGVRTWLPDPVAASRCIDKWAFWQALSSAGIPTPVTGLGTAGGVPGPWIVKPRFGRGSRDVVPASDDDDLRWALRRVPEPIVQTRVYGREFTVDVLIDRDGSLAAAVPRWRIETKGGISTKGRTFDDAALAALIASAAAAVGLYGPANVQGFAGEAGGFVIVEINPRFSGGLPLSLAAGADLVGEYLRAVRGEGTRRDRLRHRPGVLMLRHFEERFEG